VVKCAVSRAARVSLFIAVPTALLAACVPPAIERQAYEIVFTDGFDGEAPDPAVWATAPYGGSLPATVADGVLTIEATAANDYRWGYLASTGPRLEDDPNYPFGHAWQEGYVEARIRYTDNAWSWPSFWLFSMAKTEAWPEEDCSQLTSEWNVMENGVQNVDGTRPARNWYFTALHRNTTDNTDDGYCAQADTQSTYSEEFPTTDLSAWHVWAGKWTAGELCTYLDDVEIQCMEPYDTTDQLMHLTFTMQYLARCDGCPPRPSELELQVDWVRVWRKAPT
jgi:hypothetical protein